MGEIEYEVRMLEIDREEILELLKSNGAIKVKEGLQQRYVYDFNPVQKHKYIRVRTDGIKTTLTIKQNLGDTIDGTKELEMEVSDFETANQILNELGYTPKGYQENYRLEYELDGVKFDIDRWPLIPEFMEIEGPNEEAIYSILDKLKISRESVTAEGAYEHYGIDSSELEDLRFSDEEKKEVFKK